MIFGTELKKAESRIAALSSLVALTGVEIKADGELPAAEAVKAAIAAQVKTAVDAAAAPLAAQVSSSKLALDAYTAGLAAANIRLAGEFIGADKAEGADDAAKIAAAAKHNAGLVSEAIATAIGAKSAAAIARAGHSAAIDTPTPKETAEAAKSSTELAAEINAERDENKKWALFETYNKRFSAYGSGKN